MRLRFDEGKTLLLIAFILSSVSPLTAQVSYDVFATISQGFRTFEAGGYDPYRAPLGLGVGLRTGNLWRSLTLGTDLALNGFTPEENETVFKDSLMFTGLLTVGWMFSLMEDPDSSLTVGPVVGAGVYHRTIPTDSSSLARTRGLLTIGAECMLITDKSLVFGTSGKIRGFLDIRTVWGVALDVHVGYRFGGRE